MATRHPHLTSVLIFAFSFSTIALAETTPLKKSDPGANPHSKATTLTHPTANVPLPVNSAAAPSAPASSTLLSWPEAVRLAREGNADLHASHAILDQDEANIRAAWGGFLPTVSASATVQKSNTADLADADSDTARLNLTQNLFNGFGDKAKIDQAQKQKEAAQAAYDLVAAQVSSQLKSAYQNFVIAERSVKLSDDIISRRQTNLDMVTLRFEGGRENKGSVLLSKANLDQAKLERLQAANSVEAARVTLAKVLGQETLAYSDVSGTVPVNVPPLQVDFQDLAKNAPELRQAIANEQSTEEAVRAAQSGFLPTLDLTASAGRFGTTFFPATDQGVVSLSLSIPLFSGGKTYYGVKAAQAAQTNAAFARESALRAKMVDLRTTYNAYVEAVEQENVAQSFTTAAETRAEIARSQYNTGLISFQDWDTIESDLVTRQRNSLTSQLNRVTAEAAWEQSQGQGLFK